MRDSSLELPSYATVCALALQHAVAVGIQQQKMKRAIFQRQKVLTFVGLTDLRMFLEQEGAMEKQALLVDQKQYSLTSSF